MLGKEKWMMLGVGVESVHGDTGLDALDMGMEEDLVLDSQ
jgi:hypothetical protein